MRFFSAVTRWSGIAAVLVGCTATPADQSNAAENAVVNTVERLFTAMGDRDALTLATLLDSDARFIAVEESNIRRTTGTEFIERIGQDGPVLLERMWDPEVRIEGPLATLWTEYDFHVDGEFSHCGVDAFQLVETNAEWRIVAIAYTVQRENCPASPLGPPM